MLVHNYKNGIEREKEKIFNFYLQNAKLINNWDLVDLSADKIVGEHLRDKDKSILYKFVKSNNLWERRIAIISTFNFIKNNKFEDAFETTEFHQSLIGGMSSARKPPIIGGIRELRATR